MSLTKEEVKAQNVSVDKPEALDFVKRAIAGLLLDVAEKKFRLPLRFRMTDTDGDLVRECWIHKDGLELGRTSDKQKLYLFPLTASVRDVDGLQARMRINVDGVEPVEFVKGARS